jgi:7-carboxy-7-deazaguanine synthase (Cx14CxxC type)
MYSVKEIFYTLQGEGAQTGRAAVFCRFAGCNLWTGREADRASAICKFCDTDFADTNGRGGGKFASADALADAVADKWGVRSIPGLKIETWGTQRLGVGQGRPYVVCTGGEPLLQLDAPLIEALHAQGFEIAVETNGTVAAPAGLDWICVSPKASAPLKQTTGDELKLVYPQADAQPERFEMLNFRHFFLQPMDGPERDANTRLTLEYCLARPQWRISLQTHKLLGIP